MPIADRTLRFDELGTVRVAGNRTEVVRPTSALSLADGFDRTVSWHRVRKR
jgi:hypothetical protein